MAHKSNDSFGYMDGVPVKIAEKYKPPKRIILPTNTQRLTANDIRHGINFSYDFTLENSVKARIKELRQARAAIKANREIRIKNYVEQSKDSGAKCLSGNKVREADSSEFVNDLRTDIPNTNSVSYPNVNDITVDSTVTETTGVTNTATGGDTSATVLVPTPMTNTSTSSSSHSSCDTPSSTPINISDFENDTASPFDNMELKTLNDLAELAQVLQPGAAPTSGVVNTSSPNYTNTYCTSFNNLPTDMNAGGYTKSAGFVHIPTNDNRPLNGYYTNNYLINNQSQPIQPHVPNSNIYHSPYKYVTETHANPISPSQNTEDSKSRSVPDIINALQKELMHSSIEEANAALRETSTKIASSPNDTSKRVTMQLGHQTKKSKLPNPYSSLSPRLQQISREVSLMGFPLDRVARACAIIGEDQSRVVEHMIAMSQLLDLGFTEEDITKALLRCDNDRDKALDFLVA